LEEPETAANTLAATSSFSWAGFQLACRRAFSMPEKARHDQVMGLGEVASLHPADPTP
jgi:hypothetical protein